MSFAVYASQFINRTSPKANPEDSQSHPMFFSFTTDGDGDDEDEDDNRGGKRGGKAVKGKGHVEEEEEEELRLAGGSGLGESSASRGFLADMGMGDIDDEEEEDDIETTRLMPAVVEAQQVEEEDEADSSDDSEQSLPSGMIASSRIQRQSKPHLTLANSLTASLLPDRDSDTFNLPDPRLLHRRNGRRYNDALWTSLWLSGVSMCYLSAFILLFTTSSSSSSSSTTTPRPPTPYPTLIHTIPLLIPLIFLSALASYVHILFLRIWLRPAMWAGALGTPVLLLGCAIWGWAGSFGFGSGDGDEESTGLRIFSLFPLLLSIYLFYRLYTTFLTLSTPSPSSRRTQSLLSRQISQTEAILGLTTSILKENPFLLATSPVILFGALVGSVPFGVMVGRLLLVGVWDRVKGSTAGGGGGGWEWHIKWIAQIGILLGFSVWLWSWGVARGILRVVGAGVVGGWYFGVEWAERGIDDVEAPSQPIDLDLDSELAPPPTIFNDPRSAISFPSFGSQISTHTIHASFHRASHTSLGSICISALILTSIRILTITVILLINLPTYITLLLSWLSTFLSLWLPPPIVFAATQLRMVTNIALVAQLTSMAIQFGRWVMTRTVRNVERVTEKMSRYALVYVGLTGVGFWESAGRVGEVTRRVGGIGTRIGTDGGGGGGNHLTGRNNRNQTMGARKVLGNGLGLGTSPIDNSTGIGIGLGPLSLLGPALTLPLPISLLTYLFIAYSPPWGLGAPHQALGGAIIAALTSALVGVFCVGVVRDVADAVWVCWCLDQVDSSSSSSSSDERVEGLGLNGNGNGKKKNKKRGIPDRRELVRKVFEQNQNQIPNQSQPIPGPSQRQQRQQQRPGPSLPHPSIPQSQYFGPGSHIVPPPPRTQQTQTQQQQQRRGRYEEYPLDSNQPYDDDEDASDMGSPESIDILVPPHLISPVRGNGGGGGGRPANVHTHNTHTHPRPHTHPTQPHIPNDDIDIDPFAPDPSEVGEVTAAAVADEGASYLHDDMRTTHPIRAVQPMSLPMSVGMDMSGYGYDVRPDAEVDAEVGWGRGAGGHGHSRNLSHSHSRNHSRGHSRSGSKAFGSEREVDHGVKNVEVEDEGEGEEGEGEFFPGSGLFGSFGSR